MQIENILRGPLMTALVLMAVCAQDVSAQDAAKRQIFPWSSAAPARSVAPVKTRKAMPAVAAPKAVVPATDLESEVVVNGKTLIRQVIDGEVVYLDRETIATLFPEKLQAVGKAAKQVTRQASNVRDTSTSIWAKAKAAATEVTSSISIKKPKLPTLVSSQPSVGQKSSILKSITPSFFKTPSGLELPSKSAISWSKPKFSQPTTWFSQKVENPITFAPLESLPKSGKFPSSLDAPASLYAGRAGAGQQQSVFEVGQDRTASRASLSDENGFSPR